MPRIQVHLSDEMMKKYNKERKFINKSKAAELALGYLLSQPGTISAIIGSNNVADEYKTTFAESTEDTQTTTIEELTKQKEETKLIEENPMMVSGHVEDPFGKQT